jgi:precorrin-8X/cobalt-precorrin-8 methylmutase
MEWHITDAQSLAIIDSEIGNHIFSPAEYEIVRRVIYATADFEYKSLINFSERALQAGAAALAARSTVIVDVPMVQSGIAYGIKNTFVNPLYCSMEVLKGQNTHKTSDPWDIENLAKRYPEGIFVIGQAQTALSKLVHLIETEEIKPAIVIATPTDLMGVDKGKQRLQDSLIPYIVIDGRKGNAVVAAAIVDGLIDLAWKAYE